MQAIVNYLECAYCDKEWWKGGGGENPVMFMMVSAGVLVCQDLGAVSIVDTRLNHWQFCPITFMAHFSFVH